MIKLVRIWARGAAILAAGAMVALAAPSPADAQGVRYSISPAVDYVNWDDNLGLEEATFLGGRLGMDFGNLAGLEGYYYTRGDISTQLGSAGLMPPPGGTLGEQDVTVRNYGVDLTVNLNNGPLIPFVKGGAGIFEFSPNSGPDFDQVMWQYGGGIKYDLSERIRATLYVENSQFRIDRYDLAAGGRTPATPVDNTADESRSNLSVGAGLGFALGGKRYSQEDPRERWSFASFPIEPFAGRLSFDDNSLRDQELAGLRAGVNVGNYFSLRGFYWRGFESSFDATDPIQGYGLESQFNFNREGVLAPYLVLGAGNLDFRDGYRDRNGINRSDRTTIIGGAGVGIRLTEQFRLNIGARDMIYSTTGADEVASTDELRHNVMWTAGLTFNLGRGSDMVQRAERQDSIKPRRGMAFGAQQRDMDRDLDLAVTVKDTVILKDKTQDSKTHAEIGVQGNVSGHAINLPVPTEGELYVRYGEPGRTRPDRDGGEGGGMGFMGYSRGLSAADMVLIRDQVRTILREELSAQGLGQRAGAQAMRRGPVVPDTVVFTQEGQDETPEEAGLRREIRRMIDMELSLRGLPARAGQAERGADQLTAAERSELRASLAERMDSLIAQRMDNRPQPGAVVTNQELQNLESRLNDRIDRLITAMQDRREAPSAVVVTPGEGRQGDSVVVGQGGRVTRTQQSAPFMALRPAVYSGLGLDAPSQLLIGATLNLDPYVDWGAFSLVPELSFGILSGTSFMGAANVQYTFPSFMVSGRDIIPAARLGIGLMRFTDDGESSTEGLLNLTYGFSTPIGGPSLTGERRYLFIEHQGLDLFDFNRLLVGVQWR